MNPIDGSILDRMSSRLRENGAHKFQCRMENAKCKMQNEKNYRQGGPL